MRLLDLYCGAGGAGKGYADAGFEVTGVDVNPQPHYPFGFVQADAIEYVTKYGHLFDVIHASPPCQRYSRAQRIRKGDHPDLIAPSREALQETGKPYVIENVVGSPLKDPVMLCGAMFGLRTYRHRLFESSFPLPEPAHPEHIWKTTKMGRAPREGEFMHIVGNFTGVDQAREIMGMSWATREGLREAIPPAYTEYIGKHLIGLAA